MSVEHDMAQSIDELRPTALPGSQDSIALARADAVGSSSDRLRVLVLTNRFPRLGHEAIATYNYLQAAALVSHHDLRVIAPVPWTEWLRDAVGLRLHSRAYQCPAGFYVEHPIFFFPPKILEHKYGEFYLSSVRKIAERAIQEFRPDVILSCWAHPDGWAAVQLGKKHRIPVVTKLIGSDVLVLSRRPRRRVRIVEALQGASELIVVSQDIARHVVAMGVDPQRIHVVPEGIDKKLFCPGDENAARDSLGIPKDRRMLLFVGNLLLSKGAGVLVDACASLRDRGESFHCYLVGRGRDESILRAQVQKQQLLEHITFAGGRSHQQLPDWYRASDLVVLPSFSEGIPNVLREAAACGRPYVATNVGGIPEIAKPEFSELVVPGDPQALATAIARRLKIGPPAMNGMHDGNISWEESASLVSDTLGRSQL
jgi:glycosyltransferase involved in cell wall biosynthesis